MNWELISQGLSLSVMGILTTFTALGLFIGTIFLLRLLFPAESRRSKLEQEIEVEPRPAEEEDVITAAISAAIYVQSMLANTPDDGTVTTLHTVRQVSQQQSQPRTGLGARLEEPRGRWWQAVDKDE